VKRSSIFGNLKEVLPSVEHRQHKRRNNRAENSYHATRQRHRRMRCLNSAGHAHRFLAAQGRFATTFVRAAIASRHNTSVKPCRNGLGFETR